MLWDPGALTLGFGPFVLLPTRVPLCGFCLLGFPFASFSLFYIIYHTPYLFYGSFNTRICLWLYLASIIICFFLFCFLTFIMFSFCASEFILILKTSLLGCLLEINTFLFKNHFTWISQFFPIYCVTFCHSQFWRFLIATQFPLWPLYSEIYFFILRFWMFPPTPQCG